MDTFTVQDLSPVTACSEGGRANRPSGNSPRSAGGVRLDKSATYREQVER